MADLVKVVPDIRTLINQIIPPAEFASLYESFRALSVIGKQHFVEWFSGKALDSIWTEVGDGTVSMVDAVGEGLNILASTPSASKRIGFNNIRHYEHTGSVLLGVVRRVEDAAQVQFGLKNSDAGVSSQRIQYQESVSLTFKRLLTQNTGGSTTVNTDVARDTVFTGVKLELFSTKCELSLSGVIKATSTTELPTVKLQPIFSAVVSTRNCRIRFLEVFNK